MLTQILWWVGNALLTLVLARAAMAGFFRKYRAFYFYVSYVLLESLLRFLVYIFHPNAYQIFYWSTQFLSVALGYCVIWEIYRQALVDYPGAARMARCLLSVIFIAVVAKVFVNTRSGAVWSLAETTAVLERNLRTVQAVLLIAIVALLFYYGIPIGRNLRGMILGYGLFIGVSVISLSVQSYFWEKLRLWWEYPQAIAYFITLLIWCATLWSYQPNPEPKTEVQLERDYELLSTQTAKAIARARRYLVRTVRP